MSKGNTIIGAYDHRYFTGCYEWSTGTGPRAIVIGKPSLVVTFRTADKPVKSPKTAVIAGRAALVLPLRDNGPAADELAQRCQAVMQALVPRELMYRGEVKGIDVLDVTRCGAVGDGKTDNTAALQQAIDAAAERRDTVYLPAGTYRTGTLKLRDHVGLQGDPTWSYYIPGGTILQLNTDSAACLLDLEYCRGVRVAGLCLEGGHRGENVHGIWVAKREKRDREDFPAIERTMVAHFSGHGLLMDDIWCFSLRGCAIGANHGDGLRMSGADGFISDTWISGNGGAGIRAQKGTGSTTVTANRIEWNHSGGILCAAAWNWNITGNCIDRAGGAGIQLAPAGRPEDGPSCYGFTVTGNTILRCGAPLAGRKLVAPRETAGVVLEWCKGLVFSGNIINAGRNDAGQGGELTPDYAMVLGHLEGAVIRGNALWQGAVKQLILDLGEHGAEVVLAENPGSLCRE